MYMCEIFMLKKIHFCSINMQILWAWLILLILVYTETINSQTVPTADIYIRATSIAFMIHVTYFGFRGL